MPPPWRLSRATGNFNFAARSAISLLEGPFFWLELGELVFGGARMKCSRGVFAISLRSIIFLLPECSHSTATREQGAGLAADGARDGGRYFQLLLGV